MSHLDRVRGEIENILGYVLGTIAENAVANGHPPPGDELRDGLDVYVAQLMNAAESAYRRGHQAGRLQGYADGLDSAQKIVLGEPVGDARLVEAVGGVR
jgi:hypothetical protein